MTSSAPRIAWSPQPRQAEFLRRPEDQVLYGGAAGGGKSEALLVGSLRQVHIPHYHALILRKTYKALAELIGRSRDLFHRVCPSARFNSQEHVWRFPSGAAIELGNLSHPNDYHKYQGQSYDYLAFDELTHFTYDDWEYLTTRNRPKGPGTRVMTRAATNPGGVGHGWVKDMFISPAPPMTTMWVTADVPTPDGGTVRTKISRIFVPATVFDNKILLKNDPQYVAKLAIGDTALRDALLYGSWDSFNGQVFSEFRDNPGGYTTRQWTHVIEPFDVPSSWRIVRALDWGYARPFSVGWYAVDHDGVMYRFAEYYGCDGTPNQGLRLDAKSVAEEIRRIEAEHPSMARRPRREITGVADPAVFASQTGESIASLMEAAPNHVLFAPADHARIAGKMQCHNRLAFDERGYAMFYVFSNCRNFIRTVPSLVYSNIHPEDVDTDGEDHVYDEFRYACMMHPIAPLGCGMLLEYLGFDESFWDWSRIFDTVYDFMPDKENHKLKFLEPRVDFFAKHPSQFN